MKHLKITIFLFFKDASPLARTPLFDKALETLYPMLKTEQQHELDVFRPEGPWELSPGACRI
jgi:hypothetical protein